MAQAQPLAGSPPSTAGPADRGRSAGRGVADLAGPGRTGGRIPAGSPCRTQAGYPDLDALTRLRRVARRRPTGKPGTTRTRRVDGVVAG